MVGGGRRTMLRTIEVSIVILIFATAFIAATYFAVLPSPRQISSPNLRQLALTTLQVLDTNKELTQTVFKDPSDQAWTNLEIALSASLPPNLVYNLTVYDITTVGDTTTYQPSHSITNSESGLGTDSEASTYLVTTTNVSFTISPERISGTLYILNCSDANGWWITGYTGQSLAGDLFNLLSPYFNTTVMVQSTAQLGSLLDGTKISGLPHERVENAVVINTFGEAVPIPAGYYTTQGYADSSYAKYAYILGQRVNTYNWTWVSIVGYPFYYVTNTAFFSSTQNSWGIYGMRMVSGYGLGCFLRGLDGQSYSYTSQSTGSPGVVYFSSGAHYYSNYYGIYPSPYQTATRALPSSVQGTYHTTIVASVFNPVSNYYGAATFKHTGGTGKGAFTAIGLTRTPDIRVTALALLMYYQPTIYKSEFSLSTGERPTQRLVVLQLSQQGGS
jgi:hypothetical protein